MKWGNEISSQFNVFNGVKQGGVLLPIVFALYKDGLLGRLGQTGVGCQMGIHFIGALIFADDINLLSTTLSVLKVLVDVCEKYAEEYNISFNGSKSSVLFFKGRKCKVSNRGIIVNGVLLNMSELAVHLVHHVCTIDKDRIVTAAKSVLLKVRLWSYLLISEG